MKRINNYLKFFFFLSFIFIGFVYAKEANISIKSIDIYEVSDTSIEQTKPSVEGYSVSSPITFYDKDDYIKYKLVLKNNDDEDYTIDEIKDDNKNKYLKYEYEIKDKKLKAKGESIIYVKVTYNKELDGNIELTPEDSYNDTNKINISITLKDKTGEIISSIIPKTNGINPKTGDNILKYIIISIISLSIIIFILLKYKNKKSILFISIITIITLPVITSADSTFDSKVVFNNNINYNFSFLSSGWKDKITGDFTKIEITRTKDIPDEAVDISKLENGSVKGWIKDGTLYIGGHHRTYSPVDSSRLFDFYTTHTITSIDFKDNFKTNFVKNMNYMLAYNSSLSELDVSTFNTSNVENMTYMFARCSGLKKLDLSNFDTSKANVSYIVMNDTSLEELNLSGFYFTNGVSMNGITSGSYAIKKINLTGAKFLQNSNGFFEYLSSVEELILVDVDTSNVTNMKEMFSGCSNLKKLDLSSFDTSNVTDMSNMFKGCNKLEELNLSGVSFEKYNPGSGLFMYMTAGTGLSSIKKINMVGGKLPQNSNYAFGGLGSVEEINLDRVDTSDVTYMSGMFQRCNSLEKLNLIGFDFSNYNPGSLMMAMTGGGLSSIKTLNMTDAKLPQNLNYAFGGLGSVEEIILDNVDTSSSTDMSAMFYGDSSLKELDLSSFDTSNVTEMRAMFNGDSSLKKLDLSNFDTSNVTNMGSMFNGCNNLEELNLSSFDTSNVTVMGAMFSGCSNLTSIDLSSFDTSNVTDMRNMFNNCRNLEKIYVSNTFVTTKVTEEDSSKDMFKDATKLVGGAGTVYDSNHVDKEYAHIDGGSSNLGYFSSK